MAGHGSSRSPCEWIYDDDDLGDSCSTRKNYCQYVTLADDGCSSGLFRYGIKLVAEWILYAWNFIKLIAYILLISLFYLHPINYDNSLLYIHPFIHSFIPLFPYHPHHLKANWTSHNPFTSTALRRSPPQLLSLILPYSKSWTTPSAICCPTVWAWKPCGK